MSFLAALAYALLMGAIPFVEVWWTGRSPATLVLLFWFETVMGLATGAIRIVLHRRATDRTGHYASPALANDKDSGAAEVERALGDENTFLHSFLVTTTIFTIAHGLFVLLLVFLFKVAGPLTWSDATIALAWVTGVQLFFLVVDLPRIGSWSFEGLRNSVGQTSIRVLVTQLGLIFGLPAVGLFGPWGLAGTLVGFRVLADAGLSWMTGLVKQRDLPAGMRRFLAKRAKQSEASIEAEFDALKEKGREVDLLLERPIGEVRGNRAASGERAPT